MKWIGTAIVVLVLSSQLGAQNLSAQKFWHLTPDDGLSQSTVETIYQDSEGFMWFGTLEGLNKYEGQNQNIVIYKHDPNDSTSLGNDEVEYIMEDSRKNLWIGTDGGGLNLFNRDTESFKVFKSDGQPHSGKLSDNTIHTMLEDSEGNFWLGTYNGLNLMNRGEETFKNYFSNPDDSATLSNNYVTDLFEDSKGNLWVGTTNGLNILQEETDTFQRYYTLEQDDGSSNYVEVIYEDSRNRLWVGTHAGLYFFDREQGKFIRQNFDFPESEILSSTSIQSLLEDSQGVLWIGTENEGLFGVDITSEEHGYVRYTANELYGLNNNSIYSLYESRDGILWIGTFDGGLNIINRKRNKFSHYYHIPGQPNSLNENSVFSLLKAQNGDILIGTDGGGLNIFDEETKSFSAIRKQPGSDKGLPSDVVLAIEEDDENRIWLGTYNGGLTRFNKTDSTFKTYQFDSEDSTSLSNNQVFVVYEDRDGYLWAGTNGGGLSRLVDEERGIFERYLGSDGSASSFPHSYIRAIYQDQNGQFWIGTYGGGLIKLNLKNNTTVAYNISNGKLNSNRVLSIFEAEDGTIWAGTKGGGIARYNTSLDRFESYTSKDGLPNDIVNAILEDDHGYLWLSTNNGLSRFDPDSISFVNFNLNDGIQSREFKPDAAFKAENGKMYFGGINGFNKFHPDSIKINREVSPIALTDFQLFNKSVPIGKESPLKKHINQASEIVLPYTATIITFKYSVLNFNPRQGHTYAYKLEGFDSDWNHVGKQNTATYTNLDPGEYTFEVKTANSDGIWGDQTKQVGIVIKPPFWQTTWFYILSMLALFGMIAGGVKYRTRRMARLNKRLEQEVNKRTSELEQSNKELKKALKDLEETREELVRNAHKAGMADIATGVLHNIGNVLNSVTTSTTLTSELLQKSKFRKLFKANALLREHKDNLEEFLTEDPKGKQLLQYYLKLDKNLQAEFEKLEEHNTRLEKKVGLINDVIAAQQSYARESSNEEVTDVKPVIEDALTIYANSMERHAIEVEKNIAHTGAVKVQKAKLVHVLVNILQNAKDALLDANKTDRKITVKVYQQNEEVHIVLRDNGPGIKKEDLKKIFNHGYTTKKNGHGFGLHSSANYMTEMGGSIQARNLETGTGAEFIITLPVRSS